MSPEDKWRQAYWRAVYDTARLSGWSVEAATRMADEACARTP